MPTSKNVPRRPDNAGFRRIGYALFVTALLASAVVLSAQGRPGSVASGPLVELSEAALDAYESEDWQRVQDYLEAGSGQAGSPVGPAGAMQDQMLGQLEKIVLFETETASDGCSVRRYAVRFEKGLGRLEMRLCLDEGLWRLRSMEVLPDPIYFSEYLLTEIAPRQTGIQMMFAFCRQDRVHEAAGEVHCLAVTAAGETLSYVLKASEPGRLRITDARVAAEAPPVPTREVLEPLVRELLDRCSRQAGGEIRADATPGFQETVDLPLLDQVLDEVRQAFGPVRKASWLSRESDPRDGLPIVRMAVQFEKAEGEALVKLAPFQGGWVVHRFKMIAPEGSAAELMSIEKSLLRLTRDLTLDSSSTIDCPIESLSKPGSLSICRTQTHGRSVAVEVLRSERPSALGKNDLRLTSDDLQLALGRTLVELERPLGWEARSLTCDGALDPGATTRCLVRHDDGSTRLDVRVTSGGQIRVVAVENVG